MTDLPAEENGAMVEAGRRIERDAGSPGSRYIANQGWRAAREYSKQREDELRKAVAFLRSCLLSGEVSGADHPVVVAALAKNGDSEQ